jgi:hypothetical protein
MPSTQQTVATHFPHVSEYNLWTTD